MFKLRPVCFAILFSVLPGLSWGQSSEDREGEILRSSAKPKEGNDPPNLVKTVASIVEQTNAFRKAEGHKPVTVDPELKKAAEYFAQYMAKTDKYGHNADGNRPADRAEKFGYEYCLISENIAYQYHSQGFKTQELADKFVTGWKESPGHRKNMLKPNVTDTGVAVAQSAKTGHYYAVQMFGRPKDKMIEFEISNETQKPVQYKFGERSFEIFPRYTRTHRTCEVDKLRFQLPGKEQPKVVQPEAGATFSVTTDKEGNYQVEREKAKAAGGR